MRIIKASRGTPEDLIDAVESKIAELSGVDSSTSIKADTGTPEDLMYAVTDKIAELEGEAPIMTATAIKSSASVDEVLDFLAGKGFDKTSAEVKNYAESVASYLDMCEEAWDNYGEPSTYTLDQWYEDTKMNYGWTLDELPKVADSATIDSTEAIMGHDDHDIDWDKLWEISDRYVTSTPLSGDWSTEVEHEQKAISEELGVSMKEAKHLMIEHLQFPPEVFEDASLVASTKVCSGVEVIDELGIDPNELWEIVDKYTSSTPVSGDWDTETAAEQQEIADHFGISLADAKRVMIDYLGFFNEDKFIEASTDVTANSSVPNIDTAELYDICNLLQQDYDMTTQHDEYIQTLQIEISEQFGLTLDQAKAVMMYYLGYDEDNLWLNEGDPDPRISEPSADIDAATDIDAAKDPDMIEMTYSEVSASEDIEDDEVADDFDDDEDKDDLGVEVDDFYAHDLQGAIEKAILEKLPDATVIVDDDGVGEEGDDEEEYEPITELYVNITTPDVDPQGRPSINEYTVPMDELTGNIDEDVAYVLESIDELKDDSEEDEEPKEED